MQEVIYFFKSTLDGLKVAKFDDECYFVNDVYNDKSIFKMISNNEINILTDNPMECSQIHIKDYPIESNEDYVVVVIITLNGNVVFKDKTLDYVDFNLDTFNIHDKDLECINQLLSYYGVEDVPSIVPGVPSAS